MARKYALTISKISLTDENHVAYNFYKLRERINRRMRVVCKAIRCIENCRRWKDSGLGITEWTHEGNLKAAASRR